MIMATMRSQPPLLHAVAASTACGCSLYCMRLQPLLHTWKAEEEALESKNFLTATRTPAYSAS